MGAPRSLHPWPPGVGATTGLARRRLSALSHHRPALCCPPPSPLPRTLVTGSGRPALNDLMSRPSTELHPPRPFSVKVTCRLRVDMSHGDHSPYRPDRHLLPRMAVPAPGQWQPLSTLNSEPHQELCVSFSQACGCGICWGCYISLHALAQRLPSHSLLGMISWHARGEDKPQLI